MTATIHPIPKGAADKLVRFKLDCGHSRAMAVGTKRLTVKSKQKMLEHDKRRQIWCYHCGGYQAAVKLMGVEIVK